MLGWLILVTAVVVAALGAYLSANSGTSAAQAVGDFSIQLAALLAAASCGRAALSRGKNYRAWAFMALAALVWAVGQGSGLSTVSPSITTILSRPWPTCGSSHIACRPPSRSFPSRGPVAAGLRC
jgi:hypothetical protein